MLNINHFKKLTGAVLFLIAGAGLSNAQTSKFDRNFRVILEQRAQSKNANAASVISKIQNSPGIDTKTTKDGQVLFSCIIYTTKPEALKAKGIKIQSILPKFVTALVSLDDLDTLRDMPEVTFVKSPTEMPPTNDISVANSGAALLHAGVLNKTKYTGKGVLVGIMDTGIDWQHPDFRDPANQNKSRIVRMWDQMITPQGSEVSPAGFSYGVEYTQDQISAELAAGGTAGTVREKDQQGHGTHVAGTAAGNGAAIYAGTSYTIEGAKYKGLAPEADLVIVRGASTGGFSSTNVINSLNYFKNVSATLNKPIIVNMSLGGHLSAHDGTDDQEIAVDNFTASGPGRVVAIAAGNEGGTNMHKQDVIAPGASATASLVVPANTTATPVMGYVVYANAGDKFNATFTDPSGAVVNIPADSDTGAGTLINNNSFRVYAENYIDQANGKRYAYVYVVRENSSTTDAAGTWTLKINNVGTTTATINGWIFSNKSSFKLTGGDSKYIVATPGSANSAITVAAYTSKVAWFTNNTSGSGGYAYNSTRQDDIASFSSVGPRPDGVIKPEIANAGNLLVSSLASGTTATNSTDNVDGKYYQIMSGTSMATPGVAGGVALMLQVKPTATAAQIKNYITTNAQADAITGAVPNPVWGYGKFDVFQAASDMNGSKIKRKTYINETPLPYTVGSNDGGVTVNSERIAESFAPDINGRLGGIYFHTSVTVAVTEFTIEIREDNNGVPGAILGSKSVDPSYISKFSWNYINLSDLKIPVFTGKNVFVCLYGPADGKWSIRRFSTNPNNRSQISSDNGTTWSAASVGYRIRAVAYEDSSVLAVNEINNSAKLAVYPNPATDILHLRLPKNEKSKIRIYDLSGRQVKAMEGNSENIDIAVASLTSGAYLVSVETPTLKTTEKFIKK